MNDYNQTPSGWYAPLQRKAAEKSAPPKRKGLSVGWRIFLGALLVVGLIAASSLLFSDGKPAQPVQLPEFGATLPPAAIRPEEELPDDWKSFFDSYYTVEDNSRMESKIPVVAERPAFELRIAEPGGEEKSLQDIYRNSVESIVGIRTYVSGKMGYYWGTGIIISADGLILTNAHLIEGCTSAKVILQDDTQLEALLVGYDSISDLAVLKIEAAKLTPAVFGDSDALTVGDRVAAIGNPLGEEFRSTLTDGIVSASDRGMNYDGHSINLIQTNTAINVGSSGGALLNMYGQVVGVTNMKMMSSFSSIEGIGFAIPSVTVRSVVNDLIREGKVVGRPAIGITVGVIAEEAARHYNLPEGLYISAVIEKSDAWQKGIREGDIITAVNGTPARSTDDILKIRNGLGLGDSITFTIWRDGESFDVDVAMVEFNDVY